MPGFSEGTVDRNPFKQFQIWFDEASAACRSEPSAMTLATAGQDGWPAARVVLLKGFNEHGFIFYTNYESRKGRELAEDPRATLLFLWAEIRRQVRIEGLVEKVSAEESDAYFRSRPREARLAAWASAQSQVIENRAVLDQRMDELLVDYQNRDIPRPPQWGGYRLSPTTIEFWQSQVNRLHDRLCYHRLDNGTWLIERLSP